jgi:calpain-15
MVLEKAWAKVYGNYQRIEMGLLDSAQHPLTGCPVWTLDHPNAVPETLCNAIFDSDKRKFIMGCGVVSSMDEEMSSADVKKAGLMDHHAYTLIGAIEVDLDAGGKEKLIQVRNPYGG